MMRGYFGIGVEGISKEQNLGTLMRSAHSFGASFFFTVQPGLNIQKIRQSDTSKSYAHLPFYEYDSPATFQLPKKCALVAVELVEDSIELPRFRHPQQAAYILGPEMGNVSEEILKSADYVIKIPMKFCVNVGVAGAIVMYDRLLSLGKHGQRGTRPVKDDPHKEGLRKIAKKK